MHRERFGLHVLDEAENRADRANHDADIHQSRAADIAHPRKADSGQIRNMKVRLARERAAGNAENCCEKGNPET